MTLSENEILKLMTRYCFLVDAADFEGFSDLFAHGEWGMEGAPPSKGKDGLMVALNMIKLYDGVPQTKHCMTNHLIEVDEDAGTAKAQCYITIMMQTDEFPLQPTFIGHYFDDFERVDGKWRFKKRLMRHPLFGDSSAHFDDLPDSVGDAGR